MFEHYVLSSDDALKCTRCSEDIPWCEMYEAVFGFNDGRCSWCARMSGKDN